MYLVYYVRWMKNQLSHDEYVVDGRVFRAFRIVTNDLTLPPRNVRFRKETVNVGNGPTLEGHSYLKTFINGRFATVQRELLVVEFNGRLERQRRPLPACGRSGLAVFSASAGKSRRCVGRPSMVMVLLIGVPNRRRGR